MRNRAAIIHAFMAIAAVGLGLFFLGSDTLSFHFPGKASAQRPRILVCGAFFFAAVCIGLGLRERHDLRLYALGYGSMGFACFILWLILDGMDT